MIPYRLRGSEHVDVSGVVGEGDRVNHGEGDDFVVGHGGIVQDARQKSTNFFDFLKKDRERAQGFGVDTRRYIPYYSFMLKPKFKRDRLASLERVLSKHDGSDADEFAPDGRLRVSVIALRDLADSYKVAKHSGRYQIDILEEMLGL